MYMRASAMPNAAEARPEPAGLGIAGRLSCERARTRRTRCTDRWRGGNPRLRCHRTSARPWNEITKAPAGSLAEDYLRQVGILVSSRSSTSTTTTPAPQTASIGLLQAIEPYWNAIGSQNYSAAYRDLAPGSPRQNRASFVSQEEHARIQSASFSGSLAAASGAAATVAVSSLTTTDGQFGCRTWSGSYQLTRQNGGGSSRERTSPRPPASQARQQLTNGHNKRCEHIEHRADPRRARVNKPCDRLPILHKHTSIPDFPTGNGAIVRCVAAEWSRSGGLPGACPEHGGEC